MTSKDYLFYGLIVLNIAFVIFVFISRYLTRHNHHHDHFDTDDDSNIPDK